MSGKLWFLLFFQEVYTREGPGDNPNSDGEQFDRLSRQIVNRISTAEENLLLQYQRTFEDEGAGSVTPSTSGADVSPTAEASQDFNSVLNTNKAFYSDVRQEMKQIRNLLSNITSFLQIRKGKRLVKNPCQEKYVYQPLTSNNNMRDSESQSDVSNGNKSQSDASNGNKSLPSFDPLKNQTSASDTFPRIKAKHGARRRRPSLSNFASNYHPLYPSLAEDETVAGIQPPFTVTQGEIVNERFSHAAQVHNDSFENESRNPSELEYDTGTLERSTKGKRRRRKKAKSITNSYGQL